MRDTKKFSDSFSGIFKKSVAIALAVAMSIPGQAYTGKVFADDVDVATEYVDETEEPVEEFHADHMQEILDEAESLGVPNAFIRHYIANDFAEGVLQDPQTNYEEGEKQVNFSKKMSDVVSDANADGLEIKKVDTGVLARTKFHIGSFDFGELKASQMVYSFLAKKTLKGTAYLYVDGAANPITSFNIKRSASDTWDATKNLAVDVRDANLTGQHDLYVRFVADEAVSGDKIISTTDVNGSLYFESIFFTESSTPVVSFDIDDEIHTVSEINGAELHNVYGYGTMNVEIPEGYDAEYTDEVLTDRTYQLDYIKGRGNSTWLKSKKPYKVKLDKSEDVLGMPANKHWVLLANYYDYTLLRNKYTFYLAEKLGLDYTPKSVCVDIVMDGEYYGSYLLSEQVRLGKNRVDLDDLEENPATEEPDVTGGYLLSMGTSWLTDDGEAVQVGSGMNSFTLESPEYEADYPEEAKEAQISYLNDYISKIDDAVYGADDGSEDSANVGDWRDYMDEDSFIDYNIIQEFSMNGDAYGSNSTYLYKPRNDKLYWGPVWDFDFVAWGAYKTNYEADRGIESWSMIGNCPWFIDLYNTDEEFKNKVIARWEEITTIFKESVADGGALDKMAKDTYYSALANYQVASSYLIDGVDYWGGDEETHFECYDDDGNPYVLNYFNEIERLKKYVNHRAEWFDENIDDMQSGSPFDFDLSDVKFYIDDELYAQAPIDMDNGLIYDIPEDPVKEGYVFKGWYRYDEDGNEIKFNPEEEQADFIITDSFQFMFISFEYHAVFVLPEEIVNITDMKFVADTLYVPYESSTDLDFGYGGYFEGNVEIDMKDFLSILPFDAEISDVTWECESAFAGYDPEDPMYAGEEYDMFDPSVMSITNGGKLTIYGEGTGTVTARCGDLSASINIVTMSYDDICLPDDFTVEKSLELNVGDYGDVNFKFEEPEYGLIPYDAYTLVKYASTDEDVVEVDDYGNVHALKSGEANIVAVYSYNDDVIIKTTKVTVKGTSEDVVTEAPKKGAKISDKKYTYKVTKVGSKDGKVGELSITGLKKKTLKTIKVAATVTIDGVKYKVTSVAKNAFKKNNKITKVTIGKNVKTIAANAFANCKKLKSVTINAKGLKTIGKKAFSGNKKLTKVILKSTKLKKVGKKAFYRKGGKKLTFKVAKNKKKAYKKLLKKAKVNKFVVK